MKGKVDDIIHRPDAKERLLYPAQISKEGQLYCNLF